MDEIATSTQYVDRRAASRDCWPGGTLAMWHGEEAPLPDAVFWPETDAEVASLLAEADRQARVVVPYGAGSGVCGGARGRTGSWVVDTKRFDHIGAVDPETWTVELGAGVLGQALEDAMERQGYTLGHSPSSLWCSTVGGWAAARSAGQFSSRYGVFEDMVVGLDAVSPTRGAFHVGLPGPTSPSTRAPDTWMPLLLGSEGTLAVITRVRVRVRPLPETRWLRGYRFEDVGAALRAMRRLMQAKLWPAVVRLYDPVDTWIGGKTRPKRDAHTRAWWNEWLDAVDRMPEVRRRLLALPLSMPGVLRSLADGMARGCLLIVGWEGPADRVAALSEVGHALLLEDGKDLGEGPGERWYASRHAVSYKLMPIYERGGFADTMEIAARWSDLLPTYEAVRDAVGETAVAMAHMSHVYPEGGSIYFSMVGRGDRDAYERTWQAALDAVRRNGATVTHHHGVGTLKALEASREAGPAVAGWRRLKSTLDPLGILNPGRVFVPVDLPPAPPRARLADGDGLVRHRLDATVDARMASAAAAGGELSWPWEVPGGPPRWARSAWQTGWQEVRGTVGGVPCAVGRGPRSAAGPDLRAWVAEHAADASFTEGLVPDGPRWMGSWDVSHPWQTVRRVLREDFRPGMVGVRGGRVYIGFRGAAAARLGDQLRELLGTPRLEDWSVFPSPSRDLVPCEPAHPEACWATSEHVFRREAP
jgi:alkyldihydroxyacetonephosphate synthase